MDSSSPLAGKLVSKQGEIDTSKIDAPVILVYFSAHWCPPCRMFTPELAKLYNIWNKDEKQVEVIFVTSDRDQKSFEEYYGEMPWVAIPFGDDRIKQLKILCGVQGIPTLAVFSKEGEMLEKNGREYIINFGKDAVGKFLELYN